MRAQAAIRPSAMPSTGQGQTDVVALESTLTSWGFSSASALALARERLQAVGLTRTGKRNISVAKLDRARSHLANELLRLCSSAACALASAGDQRTVVPVSSTDCEVCCGSRAVGAMEAMVRSLYTAGLRSVVVVGGSPAAHAELRAGLAGKGIDLVLVDGTRHPGTARARALVDQADLIVIWTSTILDHSVSSLFNRYGFEFKTLFVSQRGVGSLAEAVVVHIRLRGRECAASPRSQVPGVRLFRHIDMSQ